MSRRPNHKPKSKRKRQEAKQDKNEGKKVAYVIIGIAVLVLFLSYMAFSSLHG